MNFRFIASSAAAAAMLASAPAAFAAEWSVSEDATFYIDASVSHTVTPDFVNMSVECQLSEPMSRAQIRAEAKKYLDELSAAAGASARVQRNGAPSIYPNSYDPLTGEYLKGADVTYTGTVSYAIHLKDAKNAADVAEAVENMGCTYAWDARLVKTGVYARQNRAELMAQINDKKEFYEEILGISLTQVSNVSISTYAESYGGGYYGSGYDPETNSVTATTTMSVTFDLPKTGKKD